LLLLKPYRLQALSRSMGSRLAARRG